MFFMPARIRFVQVLMSLHGFLTASSISSLLFLQRSGSGFLRLPVWSLYSRGRLEYRTVWGFSHTSSFQLPHRGMAINTVTPYHPGTIACQVPQQALSGLTQSSIPTYIRTPLRRHLWSSAHFLPFTERSAAAVSSSSRGTLEKERSYLVFMCCGSGFQQCTCDTIGASIYSVGSYTLHWGFPFFIGVWHGSIELMQLELVAEMAGRGSSGARGCNMYLMQSQNWVMSWFQKKVLMERVSGPVWTRWFAGTRMGI